MTVSKVDNDKKETILITGATGNIGKEVIKQLSAAGPNILVRATARSPNQPAGIEPKKIELVEADYDKPESLDRALSGIDSLFLLTPTHPKLIEFTSNLVNAARKPTGKQLKHIVKLSHIRANSDPKIEITRLHREAEKIIEESGIPFTFLRPNFFMQNFLFYGQKTSNQISFDLPAGDGKVSFVDVRDIASVVVKVLTGDEDQHIDKAYDITGPESLSYSKAIKTLSNETGKKMSYTNISDEAAHHGMKDRGMPDWHISYVMELFNITRAGYLSSVSSSVEDITGKKPVPVSQFAKDYAEFFR